jgi:hypothetical protein
MINHNEYDLHRPGIEHGLPDSKPNALPIALTGRQPMNKHLNMTFLSLASQ